MISEGRAGPLLPCTARGEEEVVQSPGRFRFWVIESSDDCKDGSGPSQGINSKVNRLKVVFI